MCTCITLQTKDFYFGRNLDLEYRFGERVVITPRNYEFQLKNGECFRTKFAMIGMATVAEGYPLYAEASNEAGLSIAGLYFPGNARYFAPERGKRNLSPFELIPWCLGNYRSVNELCPIFENLCLTNVPFSNKIGISELHWMISDPERSVVLEQTKDGLHVYDNPVGVLTNNPVFPYHLTHLNTYMNVSPAPPENHFCREYQLSSYGNGMGGIGLPGDDSPPSRFVRAAFHKLNSVCSEDEESSVSQFFHILDSVAMVSGSIVTRENKVDRTVYSCCANVKRGIYYYKSYYNNQITAVRMTDANKSAHCLTVFPLKERQQINYVN